ncbi:hypothetical protein [Flavobacterium sp. 7A]|uniref:hypothetical protein n=1 Tax=Flavobacterium sp. 7A TaxID=2940571 RepID=UPI0022271FDD|nr:hypothetical protein [Flavobacterium sp. 7A]MCW2120944.1 hypothetical protein [Flavobacterium sp. 7A]
MKARKLIISTVAFLALFAAKNSSAQPVVDKKGIQVSIRIGCLKKTCYKELKKLRTKILIGKK